MLSAGRREEKSEGGKMRETTRHAASAADICDHEAVLTGLCSVELGGCVE